MKNKSPWIVLWALLVNLCFTFFLPAETIVLKNGKQITGEILERSDQQIKVEFYGIPISYYLNEIESIDGEIVTALPKEEPGIKPSSETLLESEPPLEATDRLLNQPPMEETFGEYSAKGPLESEDVIEEYDDKPISEERRQEPQEEKTRLYGKETFYSTRTVTSQTRQMSTEEHLMESLPLAGLKKAAGGIIIFIVLFQIIVAILVLVSLWKIFTKAGEPGWAGLIPIYNMYILIKIAGKPAWWLILLFLPLVNLVITFLVYIGLAEKFGKSPAYGLGMVFLPFIFFPLIAFSDAQYSG
jgi:hypothetical protein